MNAHVLVVGSGQQFPDLLRRAAPTVAVTVLCRVEMLPHVRALGTEQGPDRVIGLPADALDSEWLAIAAAVNAVQPVTALLASGELDQDRAAAIGASLSVAAHPADTVRWTYDKCAMRDRLRAIGLEDTPATVVAAPADVAAFARRYGRPCVVKPLQGAGSVGVTVLREADDDVERAFARAGLRFEGVPDAGVMVERFHEGPQYSVEALSEGGEHEVVAITRKFSHPENFVELGHVLPADLDPVDAKECRAVVDRLLDGLGIRFGATHTELVRTAEGWRVIETHVRPAGDCIPDLVRSATGVDMATAMARQALGHEVLPEVRATLGRSAHKESYEAIWFALPESGGTLVEIRGLDVLQADPRVSAQPLLEPGDDIAQPANSDSRVAWVRSCANNAAEATRIAREAAESLAIVVRVDQVRPGSLA